MDNEFSKDPTFKTTGYDQPILEFALSLGSFKNNQFFAGGTCIVIAPYLAITAKHVIENDIQFFEKQTPTTDYNGSYYMQAGQILKNGNELAIWNIRKIFLSSVTDIAFLLLEPYTASAKSYEWRCVKIDLDPPAIGERICAFGYAKQKMSQPEMNNIIWEYEPKTSVGEVTEIHQTGQGITKFACFTTNAPWENLMSGGPIFNSKGWLCGLISTSLWSEEEHIRSTGVLLWPSMTTILDIPRKDADPNHKYNAFDLCNEKYISASGLERIELIRNTDGTSQITFKI